MLLFSFLPDSQLRGLCQNLKRAYAFFKENQIINFFVFSSDAPNGHFLFLSLWPPLLEITSLATAAAAATLINEAFFWNPHTTKSAHFSGVCPTRTFFNLPGFLGLLSPFRILIVKIVAHPPLSPIFIFEKDPVTLLSTRGDYFSFSFFIPWKVISGDFHHSRNYAGKRAQISVHISSFRDEEQQEDLYRFLLRAQTGRSRFPWPIFST